MKNPDLYPIGQQSFQNLREGGAYYVDKTEYIEKIIRSKSQYYFLGRPRRFGKSLFLSTLKCFFEGKHDLFKGLYVDSMEWDWEPWPVAYLDLNPQSYSDIRDLESTLNNQFSRMEKAFGIEVIDQNLSTRFENILRTAHERTGKQVIVLVDEYDKPLVRNLNNHDRFEFFRNQLASVYGNFKTNASHIKLVFLTGVSRFSRLNIFSDLNNIREITFLDEFADICGISEKELHEYFNVGIQALADKHKISYDEAVLRLKSNYDGYRFAAKGSEMYNPWSLLNALADSETDYYWNETGMPTLVAESLKMLKADLQKTFNSTCRKEDLQGLDLLNPAPTALLYQTGYLTIKKYTPNPARYKLGIPNKEVRAGLFNTLLPYYIQSQTLDTDFDIDEFANDIKAGHPKEFMERMQSYFASMPFKLRISSEKDLQNVMYIFISLVGLQVKAEEMTSDGAIDITIQTPDYIYLIELKYNKSARAALDQINEKGYALPYAMDRRSLIKIGANFSSRKRRIDDFEIEQA